MTTRIPDRILAVCLTIVWLVTSLSTVSADDSTEPPVVYTLEVDGKSYPIAPNEPLKLETTQTNPTVTLRVAKTRKLEVAGIAFDYPAYYTFEADTSDPDVQTWTAAGNDVTLILFSFSEPVDPKTLAQSTADALQATSPEIKPLKLTLGGAEHAGVKATMKLAAQTVIQQTIALPAPDNQSRILVVQEVRAAGEEEAAELGATLKLLASTLKLKQQ